MALKTEKYRKYYLKCSNTFLAGCTWIVGRWYYVRVWFPLESAVLRWEWSASLWITAAEIACKSQKFLLLINLETSKNSSVDFQQHEPRSPNLYIMSMLMYCRELQVRVCLESSEKGDMTFHYLFTRNYRNTQKLMAFKINSMGRELFTHKIS